MITKEERYSRQIRFSPIGKDGQYRLSQSKVLIVGAGALGTVLASHMVRSGAGAIRIADRDYVEWSNLQRQMLFDEEDAAASLPKAVAAKAKLMRINSDCEIDARVTDVTAANVHELIDGADVVLDGTDNFHTRYILNDACFQAGIPYIYGGAVGARGMSAPFLPGETCCLRCMMPEATQDGQTCETIGVVAPIVDVVASYQAIEALKLLTRNHSAVRKSLLTWDLWEHQTYEMKLPPSRADCPTCGMKSYPALDLSQTPVSVLCGRETIQFDGGSPLNLDEWEKRLQPAGRVTRNPFLLRVELPDGEKLVLFPDGRVLVQGTEDPTKAKSLFSRYLGN